MNLTLTKLLQMDSIEIAFARTYSWIHRVMVQQELHVDRAPSRILFVFKAIKRTIAVLIIAWR